VRWNYVRWIQDLLDTTSEEYSERYDPEREVVGLDIGTGASAIYSMLGCSSRLNWRMAATDIDQHSLDYARRNVNANHSQLGKRVKVFATTNDAPLIPMDKLGLEELDFVMTNPPFYSSKADMEASYESKKEPPSAANMASENEAICPGGDVGFVTRIFRESLILREKVQWYTAMLAKLSSLQQIVAKLKEHNVSNFAVTNLQAGHKTRRWAIAWSFQDFRPRNDIARHGELVHAVLPQPTAQTIELPSMSVKWAGEKVNTALKGLDVRWQWRPLHAAGVMEAKGNVWGRAARRKKQFALQSGKSDRNLNSVIEKSGKHKDNDSDEEAPIALAAKVTCREEEVEIRWLRGTDRILFESFYGMLRSALAQP